MKNAKNNKAGKNHKKQVDNSCSTVQFSNDYDLVCKFLTGEIGPIELMESFPEAKKYFEQWCKDNNRCDASFDAAMDFLDSLSEESRSSFCDTVSCGDYVNGFCVLCGMAVDPGSSCPFKVDDDYDDEF